MRTFRLTLLFAFSILTGYTQKQANIWYFGTNAGLDFNGGAPVALTNGQLNTYEGCASIADPNGALLFYTDGITVWNSMHQVMANGSGLTGNSSSTQSALIAQLPGSPNLYYIFVFDVDFRYSIVDMTLNGGLGDITSKNVLISNVTGEKQCGTYHANGFDIWILIHGTGTNIFDSYLLTAAGLNLVPVSTAIGMNHTAPYGQMKLSPDGSKVAAGVYNTGQSIEILDFDNFTGIVSNAIPVPTIYNQCYGLEFSPDNSKLYATSNGLNNDLYQFDLSAGSPAAVVASATVIGNSGVNIPAGMQLGPDGKIYLSISGNNSLDVINNPDDPGLACNYVNAGVSLASGVCGLGLPDYISSYFSTLGVLQSCLGDTTFFTSGSITGVGGTSWDFGDPASGANNISYLFTPSHYFASAGTYTVEMIKYFLNGVVDTMYISVKINTPPQFTLGNDTSICNGTSILLNAGDGFTSYSWSNGSLDSTSLATDSGTYIATVMLGGCSASDTLVVSYTTCTFPVVALSASDTSFCGKQCIDFYDLSTNSPTSWLWLFPGADSTSSTLQNPTNICYNSYGSFDVTLIACNAAGCDTLIIPNYINEFPTPATPVITSNADTLFCTPAFSYQWCNSAGPIPGATNAEYIYTLDGLYYVIITDSNGCAASSQVIYTGINESAGLQGVSVFPNPSNGALTVSLPANVSGLITWDVSDMMGRRLMNNEFTITANSFQIDLGRLSNAMYLIRIQNQSGNTQFKVILSH